MKRAKISYIKIVARTWVLFKNQDEIIHNGYEVKQQARNPIK